MKLKNVRLKVDEKTFLPMYTGEFAFNIELAQDLSAIMSEDSVNQNIGKQFSDEIKRIKDENLLNIVEYEKSLFQQIRELEWMLMIEPKSPPLGFTKHMQEYATHLLDIINPIVDKDQCIDECTEYEQKVINRALSVGEMQKYGLGLRTIVLE